MAQIVWIVSYPRSGNTFVRALLSSYVSNDPACAAMGEIPPSLGEGDEGLWTELTGQSPAERTFERQWRARPAYFEAQRRRLGDGVGLLKSHTPNLLAFGVPAFDFRPGDKIVHVVRNPCDVAVSTAAYRGLSLNDAIDLVLQSDTIIDARPARGFEAIGSWAQHAIAWTKGVTAPLHRIRYFELVHDTAAALQGLVRFLGLPVDPARIAASVEACAFDRLARQERELGFEEAEMVKSGRFFRVGQPLQFIGVMDPLQIDRMVQPLNAVLDDMGFGELFRRNGVRIG